MKNTLKLLGIIVPLCFLALYTQGCPGKTTVEDLISGPGPGDIIPPEICNDCIDNDGDGLTDCPDEDCVDDPYCVGCYYQDENADEDNKCAAGAFAVPQEFRDQFNYEFECAEIDCTDGIDNDCDCKTDCEDINPEDSVMSDCHCDEASNCDDCLDNDYDGHTDCGDDECRYDPHCVGYFWQDPSGNCADGAEPSSSGGSCVEIDCTDGSDNNHNCFTDCDDSNDCKRRHICGGSENSCNDDRDNDDDGLIDCDDDDCINNSPYCPETACDDDQDNDLDGLRDCRDDDCDDDPVCVETICDDGLDNEEDGLFDCADPDCTGDPACPETICDDDVDNDNDHTTDCQDGDCDGVVVSTVVGVGDIQCEYGAEISCADDFDNDGDGQIDCADKDCIGTKICAPIDQ